MFSWIKNFQELKSFRLYAVIESFLLFSPKNFGQNVSCLLLEYISLATSKLYPQ